MLTNNDILNLTEVISKNNLTIYHVPLVKRFLKSAHFNVDFFKIPLIYDAYQLASSKKNINKNEVGIICFCIFYDKEVFNAFLRCMPPWFGTLLEILLWQKELHRDEVEKIVGHQIVNVPMLSSNYDYLPELRFFSIRETGGYHYYNSHKTWEQAYAEKPVIFWMPIAFRRVISTFYPKPDGYELTAVKTLNEIEKSTIFNAEAAIMQEFSPLVSYYLQGNIKYSEKGRPNLSSLKKIQRTLALKEFYNDTDPALHPVRTMLVLGMLHDLKPKDISDNTASTIKKIFTQHFTQNKYPTAIANFIINQVKGINYLYGSDYSNDAALIFWDLITKVPINGWVTWKNIEMYSEAHFLEPQPINTYSYGRLYYEKEGVYGKTLVNGSNHTNMLQWPFIKGCIFLLAAYGMLEIAYTNPNTKELGKTWFSEYDGLEAFRFTALGKYVLGKSSNYEPPIIENAAKLIFDEENLIIRAEGNLNLMTTLLGNYVEKISANRFAFRPTLFLKDCKNVKQIENKITLFRKSLNVKLPIFWEAELKQMVDNATAVAEQDHFYVFKINENDKHLLRTVAQDTQLKAITIKAEKFFVLVDKKNKTAFKNRLMELGYFVEA